MTFVISYMIIPTLGDGTQWWKLASIISCGNPRRRGDPGVGKSFHVDGIKTRQGSCNVGGRRRRVARHPVRLRCRQFLSLLPRLAMVFLMSVSYLFARQGLGGLMIAAPVFAFGLVAFGFLGMGPVTIAVDS